MIGWGFVSMATMFVVGPWSFYAMRVLLGIAEAGSFRDGSVPDLLGAGRRTGADRRAVHDGGAGGRPHRRAGVGGVPGARRHLGLAGWQWLFLVEGLPAVVLGVMALCF